MTKDEINSFIFQLNKSVFLQDLWKKKDEFLFLEDKSAIDSYGYISGIYLIYIMQGELQKAREILKSFPEDNSFTLSLKIVLPGLEDYEFQQIKDKILELPYTGYNITITAGQPYIINGLSDYTPLGSYIEANREKTIRLMGKLYDKINGEFIYSVCLAEYYYQINKCYESELLISRTIKKFSDEGDMRCLFAALFQQLLLLIVNNQCPSISGYFKEMREKLSGLGSGEIMYNMAAMEAWISSYEGNYEYIYNWFETDAPDEYGDFNMLDLFRYIVKIHCYLIQENHIALVALIEKLRPYLIAGKRYKNLCLLDYLLAISLHAQGKQDESFTVLERALALAQKYRYDRLAADEGDRMLKLLLDYYKSENPQYKDYVLYLIEITRKIAIYYPYYLRAPKRNDEKFTEIESDILRLLSQGKNNEEIAESYLITVNTVKYHLKKIYQKLNVNSATAAVWQAKQFGII